MFMVGFLIRACALGKVPPDHLPFETSRDRLSTDCLLPVPPPGIEPGSPAYDARAEPTEPGWRSEIDVVEIVFLFFLFVY